MDAAMLVIEAVSSRKAFPTVKRQRRSAKLKRQIVEETWLRVIVAGVARAHGVNANQVFARRRHYRRGLLKPRTRCCPACWRCAWQRGSGPERCADAAGLSGVIRWNFPRDSCERARWIPKRCGWY